MPESRVSVIMPVYNGAADVASAVNSILAQTFPDFELIIVNDGSTDNTAAVLDEFTDTRVRVFHQANAGPDQASNRGSALARGEYLAHLDHDDRAKPTRLEKQVAFLDAHPEYAVVGTWAEIWVGDTRTERVHDHPTADASLRFELLFDNYFVHSSVMMRKSAFDAVGGYPAGKSRYPAGDYDLLSRLARRFRVANLPKRLTIYREIENSISRTGVNTFQDTATLVASENLAAALGEASVRDIYLDTAALMNGAYHRLSPNPDLAAMCRLVSNAGARIAAAAPGSDVPARAAARIATLRHRYADRKRHVGVRGVLARIDAAMDPKVRTTLRMRPLLIQIENALRKFRGKSRPHRTPGFPQ